jgi:hypothetical protein
MKIERGDQDDMMQEKTNLHLLSLKMEQGGYKGLQGPLEAFRIMGKILP